MAATVATVSTMINLTTISMVAVYCTSPIKIVLSLPLSLLRCLCVGSLSGSGGENVRKTVD